MTYTSTPLRKLPIGIQSFEFKLGSTDGRQLVKVGVSFDSEERNLGHWVIA